MRISAIVCPYSLYEDGLWTGGQVGFPTLPLAACHRLCWRPAVKTSLDRVMYHGGERNLIRYAQLGEHLPQVGVHGVRRDVQPLATAFLKRAVADRRAGYGAIPCKLRTVTGQIPGQLGGVAYALQARAPECPRDAINSQRSAPTATCEHEASAGFEPASNAW
jgi:hypothetical protein